MFNVYIHDASIKKKFLIIKLENYTPSIHAPKFKTFSIMITILQLERQYWVFKKNYLSNLVFILSLEIYI